MWGRLASAWLGFCAVGWPQSGSPPELTARNIVNAADYRSGSVAPGEIVVLYSAHAGPPEMAEWRLDSEGRAADPVGETRVFFDNLAAPVVYSMSGQVCAIVPYEVASRETTQVVLEYQGLRSAAVTVPVVASAPALFALDASGKGQAAMLNETGCCNSVRNPAPRGSIVSLYGTGEGPARPPASDVILAPGLPPYLRLPQLPVRVWIGGVPAEVRYVGNLGLLQVNVRVPDHSPVGDAVPVVLAVGDARSSDTITMAIRSARRQVLVVGREPAIRTRLTQILQGAGYEVFPARGVREAEARGKGHPVDLLIADVAMAEDDGPEMVRALRMDHPKLKLMALSGTFGPAALRAADLLGAQAVLRKPLSATMVVRRARELLREPAARY